MSDAQRFSGARVAVTLIAIFLLLPSLVQAEVTITPEMRTADPRLEKPVTVRAPRLYIGELLEIVSEQTGVDVSASDRDGAAGEQVAVFVKDMPLGEFMDDLWSLMSYRGAYRRWERESDKAAPGVYRYRFLRPAIVDEYAVRLRQNIQNDFEDEVAARLKALALSPEDLKVAAEKDPRLNAMGTDEDTRKGLKVLADSLTDAQRQALLKGQHVFVISAAQLTESGRDYVDFTRENWQRWNPGAKFSETTSVRLETLIVGGKMTPSLFIQVEPFGGFSYVGGNAFERRWQESAADDWMLPEDTRTDTDHEAAWITKPRDAALYDKSDRHRIEGRRLAQLAGTGAAPAILARLPMRRIHGSEFDPQEPYDRTLADFLSRMNDGAFPHKWRHGALLISNYNWFNNADSENRDVQDVRLSWGRIKQWRFDRTEAGGILPLADLCESAHNLTRAERERYGFEEIPEIGVINDRSQPVRDLFDFFGSHSPAYLSRLKSSAGIPLSQLPASFARMMEVIASNTPGAVSSSDRITNLRVTEVRGASADSPALTLHFEALGVKGAPLCAFDEWIAGPVPKPVAPRLRADRH